MKRLARLSLVAAATLPLLSACGLRGDLKRPDPIFEDEKEAVAETPTTTRVVTNTTVIRRNAEGGIIPDASPTTPVNEGGLEDIE